MILRSTLIAALLSLPAVTFAELHVLIVEGLGGETLYKEQFSEQVDSVETAALTMTAADNIRTLRVNIVSRDAILTHFEELQQRVGANDQVHVYLLGHGSYDDVEYKFNIPGPDLTDEDLLAALDAIPSTRQLLVNTSSASGAISDKLSSDNRILILATRSGVERHATRFGTYFSAALSASGADIDKNRQISAKEAFDFATRQVGDYFEANGQLATEHARLDGAAANRLSLARLGGARPSIVSVAVGGLIADRDALNAEIETLRLAKDAMDPQEYQSQLLQKMLELARAEDAIEAQQGGQSDED